MTNNKADEIQEIINSIDSALKEIAHSSGVMPLLTKLEQSINKQPSVDETKDVLDLIRNCILKQCYTTGGSNMNVQTLVMYNGIENATNEIFYELKQRNLINDNQ